MVQYLQSAGPRQEFSRLSLAVVCGVLEYLVEATPHRAGRTYLRTFHNVIHEPGGTGAAPYYTKTRLPLTLFPDLEWWAIMLKDGRGRHARATRSATLVPQWGDGSGTGTGWTLGMPDQPLTMWKGAWSPAVFHFTSNWKELRTILLSLQQIAAKPELRLAAHSTTLFYFTDNMVSYYIAAGGCSSEPQLHLLIRQIKLLEFELDLDLRVIHVPGVVMILQGSDGLSRGVWMSRFHRLPNQLELTASVFNPLTFDADVVNSCLWRHYLSHISWRYQPWHQPWDTQQHLHRCTVWMPPPELARQAIYFALETWVEAPATTSALFFIPRTLAGSWRGLSRYIFELEILDPTSLPNPPALPIPIVVLYLPPHTPVLCSPPRLDASPLPANARWHRQQAAFMRGLPPAVLSV
jgi:hypothetical protein